MILLYCYFFAHHRHHHVYSQPPFNTHATLRMMTHPPHQSIDNTVANHYWNLRHIMTDSNSPVSHLLACTLVDVCMLAICYCFKNWLPTSFFVQLPSQFVLTWESGAVMWVCGCRWPMLICIVFELLLKILMLYCWPAINLDINIYLSNFFLIKIPPLPCWNTTDIPIEASGYTPSPGVH